MFLTSHTTGLRASGRSTNPARRWVPALAAAAAVVCAAGVSATAASAEAPGGHSLFVSHTGTAGAADTSCAKAAYSSVQAAVNAAGNGDRVYLCGTTTPFTESVVIQNKGLLLTGDDGAAIRAPANAAAPTTFFSSQNLQTPNSVVTVIGGRNVQINGLIVEGPFVNVGCGGDDFGILQVGAGHLQLNNDQVLNIQAVDQIDLAGCQYGVGVQIGRRYWPVVVGLGNDGFSDGYNLVNFTGNAQLEGVSVSGYQKNGITADGRGTQIQVQDTTVDGGGQTLQIARNGIQIGRGATGQVADSAINNNEYTGAGSSASATAVLIFGGCGDPLSTNIQVRNNKLHNNDTGISAGNFNAGCTASTTSPTNVQMHDNVISKNDGETNHSPFTDQFNNAYTGYQVGIADTGSGDSIHNNTITGTVVVGVDTAYGPQTAPGFPFLAPIDIQTYPPAKVHVNDNTYDGHKTSPPY
jgi:hypothetical protein